MKLRYQTFRQRYQISSSKRTGIDKIKKRCIKEGKEQLKIAMNLYQKYGLMDDRKPRKNGALSGPFKKFTILEIERWSHWSNLELEGEVCSRIWYFTK
jgi:hypothetical protein